MKEKTAKVEPTNNTTYELGCEAFNRLYYEFIKDAYENRAKCFRNLAESEEDPTKKAELIAKAEADEKKAESLKKD